MSARVLPPGFSPSLEVGDDSLQLQITRAWLALLPGAADRNRFAVRPYRVHHELAEQLVALPPALEPVADAAVRILTGYAWTQATPIPVRVERDGVPVLRRHDLAVAWRYPLPGAEQWLYWWQPPVGSIMLARFAAAGSTTLPGAATARPTVPPVPPADSVVPDMPAAPRRRAGFSINDDALLEVLQAAPEPMYVSELRQALGIPDDVARERVSKALGAAIDRGVIVRTGQRRGTRYGLPN